MKKQSAGTYLQPIRKEGCFFLHAACWAAEFLLRSIQQDAPVTRLVGLQG